MKRTLLAVMAVSLLVVGCGANKKYVNEQVLASEERQNTRLASVESKTAQNTEDLAKLQTLALELSRKTDLAINQVQGFEKYTVIWQGEISFGFDQYDIEPEAQAIVDEAGRQMMEHPRSIGEIAGFTDHVGTREYNYVLGERRANSVRRYLAENYSVGLFRLFTVSHGKDKADSMPDQPRTAAKQRRVMITVWAPPSPDQASVSPSDTMQAQGLDR